MAKAPKSLVLLSGGLDSVASLHIADRSYEDVLALTINYRQKSLKQELAAAEYFCKKIGVAHIVLDVPWFAQWEGQSLGLIHKESAVPTQNLDLSSVESCQTSAAGVWIPNRNGLFIHVAASYAEMHGISQIYVGFNLEEAQTFPDNSKAFLNAVNESLVFSTKSRVQVKCPTIDMTKKEIVQKSMLYDVNFEKIWPCYQDGETPCGQCESCLRFIRATHGLVYVSWIEGLKKL